LERRKFRNFLRFHTTYIASAVALESAGVDIDICTICQNSAALGVACPPPGIGAKKVQEISETRFCTTYIASTIAIEHAGVDLGTCTAGINSATLEVACPPPGIGVKF
jgi:hypothetical protein